MKNTKSKMKNLFIAVGIITFLLAPTLSTNGQEALEIIKKVDQKQRGDYSEQEMKMTIQRPEWERSISLKSWSKGTKFSLILITAPAKEKGQVFLKRDNEMWNWVPSIERMIKIPPSMMMQSWMGSDFTNDDLVRESSIVNDYHHQLVGEEEIDGAICWKLQLKPKEDAPVVWGKIIAWIDKDYNQRKVEYYDEDEYLVNIMNLKNIKMMDDREIPTRWEMIPADEEGNMTLIELIDAKFDKPIPESYFSQQNMKRVR